MSLNVPVTLDELRKEAAALSPPDATENLQRRGQGPDNAAMKIIRSYGAKEHGKKFPCPDCGFECKVENDVYRCERHGGFAFEIFEHNRICSGRVVRFR